jgi:hypothetical protein
VRSRSHLLALQELLAMQLLCNQDKKKKQEVCLNRKFEQEVEQDVEEDDECALLDIPVFTAECAFLITI